MSYAVFAFDVQPHCDGPDGGWNDHKGTVHALDEAVTLAQKLHAYHVVQVVDLRFGSVLDVPRPDPPTCAHGVSQRFDFRLDAWRSGKCAPCLMAEAGQAALVSVPGTTPGAAERFR